MIVIDKYCVNDVQLQILFDDSLTATYEYPSEQSLMAATPAQPGDIDYEGEDMVHGSGLLVTPSIVAAGWFHSVVLPLFFIRNALDFYP